MLWHHCHLGNIDSLVVDAFPTKFCPANTLPWWNVFHSGTVLYPSVIIDEFGGVLLQ